MKVFQETAGSLTVRATDKYSFRSPVFVSATCLAIGFPSEIKKVINATANIKLRLKFIQKFLPQKRTKKLILNKQKVVLATKVFGDKYTWVKLRCQAASFPRVFRESKSLSLNRLEPLKYIVVSTLSAWKKFLV